jgi:hypothetical protein
MEDIRRSHAAEQPSTGATATIDTQLANYMAVIANYTDISDKPGLSFWADNASNYKLIYSLAQDLVAAPASEAYAERVFSLCGDMCARKRNRASANLERRVFLKMNKKYSLA